jgi:hypothetical protein
LKRINPNTNKFFVQGNVREDGRLFWGYVTTCILSTGFFKENWLNKESYQIKRNKNKNYLRNQRLTQPKKYSKSASKWQKLNPDKVCASASRRRVAKLNRTPNWLTVDHKNEINDFYSMAKQLESIFPWGQHVDHIIPLRGRTVSGLHVPRNLQILSAKMNREKGNLLEKL